MSTTQQEMVEAALEEQALRLVAMMTRLFDEAEAAVGEDEVKAVSKKAWMHNSLGRAWMTEKRVVDAVFRPAPLLKGGSGDGKSNARLHDELEEQIRRGTERLDELLGKPTRRSDARGVPPQSTGARPADSSPAGGGG